ncbi:MAG: pirin family protein, partial [Nitrospinota bacterium]
AHPGTWPGIGRFVYLSDARFLPKGETGLHPHQEIDVISAMVEGRVVHGGSLEDGRELAAFDVQVQRGGGEGFEHNEINPDDRESRMIQMWALPERPGEPAGYKAYRPDWGATTRVYGGPSEQTDTFAGGTQIHVALLRRGGAVSAPGEFMAYIVSGRGEVAGTVVSEGDMLRGGGLDFRADSDVLLIWVHTLP